MKANNGERDTGDFQTTTFDALNRQRTTDTRYRRIYGPHTTYVYEDTITEYYDGDGHSLKSFQIKDRISGN